MPGSCVLLVISSPGRDSRLLLPWLILHLALIIVLVVGGTGLLCHLLINLRQVTLLFISFSNTIQLCRLITKMLAF